jgi:hypothetical protein
MIQLVQRLARDCPTGHRSSCLVCLLVVIIRNSANLPGLRKYLKYSVWSAGRGRANQGCPVTKLQLRSVLSGVLTSKWESGLRVDSFENFSVCNMDVVGRSSLVQRTR